MYNNIVYQVVTTILATLVSVGVAYGINYLEQKLGSEKFDKAQQLAGIAVGFVLQVYTELHGPEKYQKTVEWLATEAKKHGLNLSETEMKALIEYAVKAMNDLAKKSV
jgi:LL-H family phage holin